MFSTIIEMFSDRRFYEQYEEREQNKAEKCLRELQSLEKATRVDETREFPILSLSNDSIYHPEESQATSSSKKELSGELFFIIGGVSANAIEKSNSSSKGSYSERVITFYVENDRGVYRRITLRPEELEIKLTNAENPFVTYYNVGKLDNVKLGRVFDCDEARRRGMIIVKDELPDKQIFLVEGEQPGEYVHKTKMIIHLNKRLNLELTNNLIQL